MATETLRENQIEIKHQYTRDQYVYLAELAEQSESYEDMAKFMLELVDSVTPSSEITEDERDLLALSYKNYIGKLREHWRVVFSIQEKEECLKKEENLKLAKDYKAMVESKLTEVCSGILKRLDSVLLPSATTSYENVFYLKMKGDYHRYLAEFKVGDERQEASDNALASYMAAQDIVLTDMRPSDPLRLGVALNLSVFHFDILDLRDKACSIGQKALDEASADTADLDETSYDESNTVMQLIRDNLGIWNDNNMWKLKAQHMFCLPRPLLNDS